MKRFIVLFVIVAGLYILVTNLTTIPKVIQADIYSETPQSLKNDSSETSGTTHLWDNGGNYFGYIVNNRIYSVEDSFIGDLSEDQRKVLKNGKSIGTIKNRIIEIYKSPSIQTPVAPYAPKPAAPKAPTIPMIPQPAKP